MVSGVRAYGHCEAVTHPVGDDLGFSGNDGLTSLAGLDALTSVDETLSLAENASLTDLSGLDVVTSIEGSARISRDDALVTLDLVALTSVGSDLTNSWNDEPYESDIDALVAQLTSFTGTSTSDGNVDPCP